MKLYHLIYLLQMTCITLLLGLLSCNNITTYEKKHEEWTEKQKRNYFADSIAYRDYNGRGEDSSSLNNWHTFADSMYSDIKARYKDAYTYALEEPYIDTTKIDSLQNIIRLFVYPSFDYTYCYVVEKKYRKTYLTIKMLDRAAGSGSGMLDFSFTQTFPDSVYESYSNELRKANFWNMEDDSTCRLLDGEYLSLKVIENGHYHEVFTPFPCTTDNAILLERLRDSLNITSNFHIMYFGLKKRLHYTRIKRKY